MNAQVLVDLLERELVKEENDLLRIDNILFHINILHYHLPAQMVDRVRQRLHDKGLDQRSALFVSDILRLIKRNQESEEKIAVAKHSIASGHYYAAYVFYKFAGKLTGNILNSIINQAIKHKNFVDLADIVEKENKTISKHLLKDFGNLALKENRYQALFYFYKLGSKKDFEHAVKDLFPQWI